MGTYTIMLCSVPRFSVIIIKYLKNAGINRSKNIMGTCIKMLGSVPRFSVLIIKYLKNVLFSEIYTFRIV
jgi:hypothetical protein